VGRPKKSARFRPRGENSVLSSKETLTLDMEKRPKDLVFHAGTEKRAAYYVMDLDDIKSSFTRQCKRDLKEPA